MNHGHVQETNQKHPNRLSYRNRSNAAGNRWTRHRYETQWR